MFSSKILYSREKWDDISYTSIGCIILDFPVFLSCSVFSLVEPRHVTWNTFLDKCKLPPDSLSALQGFNFCNDFFFNVKTHRLVHTNSHRDSSGPFPCVQ